MMRILAFSICFISISSSLIANDGIYISGGGQIYPVKESSISMDKEILSFVVRNQICTVDVYFEFLNPSDKPRKTLVGFQAPFPIGDFQLDNKSKIHIKNFKVNVNNLDLPVEIKAASCEDCPLVALDKVNFSEDNYGAIYVFLFEVTFKPGLNIVKHTYNFPASKGVYLNQSYNYILNTGSKWANGTIKDFELNIDLGSNRTIFVHDVFPKSAKWTTIGEGKIIKSEKLHHPPNLSQKWVRINQGTLKIHVKDFHPVGNIDFGIYNIHSMLVPPNDNEGKVKLAMYWLTLEIYGEKYSWNLSELRILRNAIYAFHGYVFKSADLDRYFKKCDWYFPNPNLKIEDIKLSSEQQRFVEEIIRMEKVVGN